MGNTGLILECSFVHTCDGSQVEGQEHLYLVSCCGCLYMPSRLYPKVTFSAWGPAYLKSHPTLPPPCLVFVPSDAPSILTIHPFSVYQLCKGREFVSPQPRTWSCSFNPIRRAVLLGHPSPGPSPAPCPLLALASSLQTSLVGAAHM